MVNRAGGDRSPSHGGLVGEVEGVVVQQAADEFLPPGGAGRGPGTPPGGAGRGLGTPLGEAGCGLGTKGPGQRPLNSRVKDITLKIGSPCRSSS